jgi:DUF4097 and DUF4098 domain-containing protein YvlB
MKKIIWIPLIILIIGVCLALAGFAQGGMKGFWLDRAGFHLSNNSPGNLIVVDESYKSFKNIEINADFINRIEFKEGSSYAVRGQNYERNGGLDAELKGDTLVVDARADQVWQFSTMGFFSDINFRDTWIEITYPAGTKLGLVKTNLGSGNISFNSLECSDLDITNSFGDVDISSVKSDKLKIFASSGDIGLTDADVSGSMDIRNSFGDATLKNIKSGSLDAKLDSGKFKATEINANTVVIKNSFGEIVTNGVKADKMTIIQSSGDFDADNVIVREITVDSSFGAVTMDRLTFTELCKVENDSGDIMLSVLMNRDDVSYELNTNSGSVTVDRSTSDGSVSSRSADAAATLKASASFGDIRVEFLG